MHLSLFTRRAMIFCMWESKKKEKNMKNVVGTKNLEK